MKIFFRLLSVLISTAICFSLFDNVKLLAYGGASSPPKEDINSDTNLNSNPANSTPVTASRGPASANPPNNTSNENANEETSNPSGIFSNFTNIFTGNTPDTSMDYQVCDECKQNISLYINEILKIIKGELQQTLDVTLLDEGREEYLNYHQSCGNSQGDASKWCLETNPDYQAALTGIQAISTGSNLLGVTDSCGQTAKIINIADKAISAYKISCAATKARCDSNCSTAFDGLDKIKKFLSSVQRPLNCLNKNEVDKNSCNYRFDQYSNNIIAQIKKELNVKNSRSIAFKKEVCWRNYQHLLWSAAATGGSLLKSLDAAKACEKQTASAGQTLEERCKTEQYKNSPDCLCIDNPRLPGCQNSLTKTGQGGDGSGALQLNSGTGLTGTSTDGSGVGLGDTKGSDEAPTIGGSSGSGAGLPGPSSGGGAGLDGGGTQLDALGAENHDGSRKGLNTNVLSGSGGGGGGAWGGSGSSESYQRYRAYLPGGAKDPTAAAQRNIASEAWKKEVTGQMGKSNWEKIRDRYRDNRFSLMNK